VAEELRKISRDIRCSNSDSNWALSEFKSILYPYRLSQRFLPVVFYGYETFLPLAREGQWLDGIWKQDREENISA
jgi:hypothetical protein